MSDNQSSYYGIGNGREIDSTMCYDRRKHLFIGGKAYLPHWQQDGVLQFITFRLADSLPQSKLTEMAEKREEWLKTHPKPWSDADSIEFEKLEIDFMQWLDARYGACELRFDCCRKIVVDALRYFEGLKYDLYDYVVMPNHVHFIILPYDGEHLPTIMHSIKSFTTKEINRLLKRQGKLWQREYFDRLIRSVKDYEETAAYILENAQTLQRLALNHQYHRLRGGEGISPSHTIKP